MGLFKDWMRGWSEADLESAKKKIRDAGAKRSGCIINVTRREMRALTKSRYRNVEYDKEHNVMAVADDYTLGLG